jgi:hypothetical protein
MRSTKDVLNDHLAKRLVGDLEADLATNYAEDVQVLSGEGCRQGLDAMRQEAARLEAAIPGAQYEYRQVMHARDVGFLEWQAHTHDGTKRIFDGADSYVVRDGRIIAQTIHYTVGSPER